MINEQNEMTAIRSGLMANYAFTEAVMIVVSSQHVNFIEKAGS